MPASPIPALRLHSQQLAGAGCESAAQVVAALGAVQAQDYGNALWALGCRTADACETDIEQAVRERALVRTWPMRGTLHFVPAEAARWMLALLTPRMIASTVTRVRNLELDGATFAKAERVLVKALQGGALHTREDTLLALERAKISTAGGRGYHLLFRLSLQGVLCFGPRKGKQQTFVLLDEWVPATKPLGHEEALALLARRYFGGHGPATVKDFVWWSGLIVADAKAALASVSTELECLRFDGAEYWHRRDLSVTAVKGVRLLPGFDEYLLGYKERAAVLDAVHAGKVVPGSNGIFLPLMVKDGRIIGTWQHTVRKIALSVSLAPFAPLTRGTRKAFETAAARYGDFLGLAATVTST